jgi:dTDP-4-amino-4,6-dideoxygalactose transaminase
MKRADFLPFSPPCFGDAEIAEVVDTLRSDWVTTGPKTRRFELEFAQFCGAPAALGLNSCTAGLHTALAVLGVGAGDEVLVPTLTFCATANVVEHLGGRAVPVDVEEDTLCMDPRAAEAAVTPRTRAVVPVHYAGHAADLDAIADVAAGHGLAVVEDAAHAVWTRYRGAAVGSHGRPTAFSFYATKNLSTAEGGMLTGHAEFVDRARVLALHGMSRDAYRRFDKGGSWRYDVEAPGFKYNMTDVAASLGLHQLAGLEGMQARRAEVWSRYDAAFGGHPALRIPSTREDTRHGHHLYVLRLRLEALRIDRDVFFERMRERNIGCSVHYTPLHRMSYYRERYGLRPEDFPVAERAFGEMISLPLHPRLSEADVSDVVEAVLETAAEAAA